MRKGKRLFPYPTINNSKVLTCYKNSVYSLEYDDLDDENNLLLKNTYIRIENDQIVELIKKGKAKAGLIVECSATIYRKIFDIGIEPKDIAIPLSELRDKVEISSFIYATEDQQYTNDDFLEDYSGYTFNIEKYDILAIDDGFTTKVEYDEKEDKKVSSIFSIIKNMEASEEIMKIESGDKKIKIILPEKQFNYYDTLKDNDNFQNIFFSIIAIPALAMCFEELKYNYQDIDEILMQHSWFSAVMKAYKNIYNMELTFDLFCDEPSDRLAQKVLNNASVVAIEDFFNLFFKKKVGELDNE